MGSAHTDADLKLLLTAARERLRPGQQALDLGSVERAPARVADVADWTRRGDQPLLVDRSGEASGGRPRVVAGGGQVVGTSALLLWDVLAGAYARLGFDTVGDDAFRALVLARIVEPTSKADTIRVLNEIGVKPPSLNTIYRCLDRSRRRKLPRRAGHRVPVALGPHGRHRGAGHVRRDDAVMPTSA